jgi:hypothetical protein
MHLFFLTIPKPLKQYTIFKKDDPFRSLRLRLIIICCVCSQGLLSRVTILAEWLCHFNDLAVGETAFSRELFAGERGGGRNATSVKSLK